MNHAITIADLLCVLGIIAGIIGCLFGGLMFFAGMMADTNDEGTSGRGFVVGAASFALVVVCIVKLL